MTEDETKLECLRLAHNKDQAPENIINRARQYSDYVLGRHDILLRQKVQELAAVV